MLPNTTIHIKDHGELNQPNSMRIYFAKTPNKSYSGNTVHSNTITLTLGIKKRKKKIVATLQNTFRVDTSTLSLHCCSQCCYHEKMSCNTGHWLRFNHVPLRYEIKIINTIEVQLLGLSDLKIRTSMGKIRSVCFFSSCACILNNTYLIEMNTKWPKWRFLSKYHDFWIFFFLLLRVVFHIVVTDFIERLSVLSIKEIQQRFCIYYYFLNRKNGSMCFLLINNFGSSI